MWRGCEPWLLPGSLLMGGGHPWLLAPAVQPDAVRAAGPVPGVQRVGRGGGMAAVVAAAEGLGNADTVVGGSERGAFLVRIALATLFGVSIRRSVETRMAVRQVAVFRSVAGML